MMIKEAIIRLSQKQDLSYDEAEQVMNEIMEGKATDVQMSAYLTALSLKGETIDEITASAAGMRAHCIKLLGFSGDRRGGSSGGKTRKPGRLIQIRSGRRAGGSGR